MGTDCKSAAFQLRWFESTRAHQKTSTYESTLRFLFCVCVKLTNAGGFEQHRPAVQSGGQKSPSGAFLDARLATSTRAHQKSSSVTTTLELFVLHVRETHECGRIRTAAALSQKTAQKQPLCNSDDRCQRQKQGGAVGAAASRMRVPPKARCSRWEPRPGLLILRGSRNPPAPTKRSSIRTGYWIFCFVETFSGPGGKKVNVKTKVRFLLRPAGCVKLEEKIARMRCILGGNRL